MYWQDSFTQINYQDAGPVKYADNYFEYLFSPRGIIPAGVAMIPGEHPGINSKRYSIYCRGKKLNATTFSGRQTCIAFISVNGNSTLVSHFTGQSPGCITEASVELWRTGF